MVYTGLPGISLGRKKLIETAMKNVIPRYTSLRVRYLAVNNANRILVFYLIIWSTYIDIHVGNFIDRLAKAYFNEYILTVRFKLYIIFCAKFYTYHSRILAITGKKCSDTQRHMIKRTIIY